MHSLAAPIRSLVLAALGLALLGCPGEDSTAPVQARARARAEDPPLVHTWNLPAGSSRILRGDLGSKPPELSDALMQSGAMPTFVHKAAQACDSEGTMPTAGDVALRFGVKAGTLEAVQGDPKGPAATCFESQLRGSADLFKEMPDGSALVRVEIAAPPTP